MGARREYGRDSDRVRVGSGAVVADTMLRLAGYLRPSGGVWQGLVRRRHQRGYYPVKA